jgi:hypothetical protein
MGLVKYLTFLNKNHKGYGQDLYLFGVKKEENIWDIKEHYYFSTAMTDLFQKMIASNKWFYLVLTLLFVHTTLHITKEIVLNG